MKKEIILKVDRKSILQNLNVVAPILILIGVGLVMGAWGLFCLAGLTEMTCSIDKISEYLFVIPIIVFSFAFIVFSLLHKGRQYSNKKIILFDDKLILEKMSKQTEIPYNLIKEVKVDKSIFEKFGLKKNLILALKPMKSYKQHLKQLIFICSERALKGQELTIDQVAEEIRLKIKQEKSSEIVSPSKLNRF